MYAMHNTLKLNPKLDPLGFETWAKKALDGFRKRKGFRGFLVLAEDEKQPAAYFITLWNTKQDLHEARKSVDNRERRETMNAMLETPLEQRPCNVLVTFYEDDERKPGI